MSSSCAPWPCPGAIHLGSGRTSFAVWAPRARAVEVLIGDHLHELVRDDRGWHSGIVEKAPPGTRYCIRLDEERTRPDPASRSQPEGVHGPSAVVSAEFPWTDAHWNGVARADLVFYELHVGTFTTEGTFDAAIGHLDELRDLGVTALELMPIAEFPGARNWGYDGVAPFAAHSAYGGLDGLRRLVDACHARGLAILLDVVYNHLGPEGNYLADFGPYFTEDHRTPWGPAINFAGAGSDAVRRFFIESALHWVRDCHVDGLRLDAVHAIHDESAIHFLAELALDVDALAARTGRRIHLVAESDANDPRCVRPRPSGFGLGGQWNEDYHHALHVALTGERSGYYADFEGVRDVARCLSSGWVYTGQRSRYRKRRHGAPCPDVPFERLVGYAQNHDQVGNRAKGERLASLVGREALKLAAGAVVLSPFLPLIFMGEEWGETAPFLYFTSHGDPELVRAVREGRKREFAFAHVELADCQSETTFLASKLDRARAGETGHRELRELMRTLLRLRRERPALRCLDRTSVEALAFPRRELVLVHRRALWEELALLLSFGRQVPDETALPLASGTWRVLCDSADERWLGPGAWVPKEIRSDGEVCLRPRESSFVLLERA